MNSFRTSADTMAAVARYEDLPVEGLPLEFWQNKEPKLLEKDLLAGVATRETPTSSGVRPATATSTPRCAAPACSSG